MAGIVCSATTAIRVSSLPEQFNSCLHVSHKSNLPFPTLISPAANTRLRSIGVKRITQIRARNQIASSVAIVMEMRKKEILCGNCNGAGFVGGFMSTLDETSQ